MTGWPAGQRDELYARYEAKSGRPVDRARTVLGYQGHAAEGDHLHVMADSFPRCEGHLDGAAAGRRSSEAEVELLHVL